MQTPTNGFRYRLTHALKCLSAAVVAAIALQWGLHRNFYSSEHMQIRDISKLEIEKKDYVITAVVKINNKTEYLSQEKYLNNITDENNVDDDNNNKKEGELIIQKQQPLCTMEQLKEGTWKPHVLTKPPYNPGDPKECYGEDGPNMTLPFHTYKWKANLVVDGTCSFPTFESFRKEFCEYTHNKTIFFVGDSLTLEQFQDLLYSTTATSSNATTVINLGEIFTKENTNTNFFFKTCPKNTTTLVFRRTNFLGGLSQNETLTNIMPDILLINTGQWYSKKIMYTIRQQFQIMKDYRSMKNNSQIVWRTIVPGHPNCTQYKEPSTSRKEMENLVEKNPLNHWNEFKTQNQKVYRKFILPQRVGKIDILPSYDFVILRPDAHRRKTGHGTPDCLHSCLLDGGISHINHLFLQLIKLHAIEERKKVS